MTDQLDKDDVIPQSPLGRRAENQNRKAQGLPPLPPLKKKEDDDKKKKKKKPNTTSLMGGGKIGKPIKYAVGGPVKPAWMRNR